MAYATYSYYEGTYCGKMTEAEFNRLSRKASAYMDTVCSGALTAAATIANESVQDCCCALADDYLLMENGGGVASATNDGIAVNFVNGISAAPTEAQRLNRTANLYLGRTGLLFRGVR